MNHLHFTQSLEPLNGGGLGTSTVALHRHMRSNGLNSVLCSTHGGTPQNCAEGILEFRRTRPDFLYFSPALLRQAAPFVRDADVLHGHGLYVGTNLIFGRQARHQRKPLVYHVHGMFEPYILNRSQWKKRFAHWLFENDNFRQVRFWRALTSKEAGQIRARGVTQPIVVAPNGLDVSVFRMHTAPSDSIETPLAGTLQKTGRRALFLGRLHPKKGLDLLLSAWAALGTLTRDWQLVIAGPDEQNFLAGLEELARSLNLIRQVVFTGPMTGEAKLHLLHSADLFVLPSYSEGFSVGILEALACGLPVLATHACNFPEISSTALGWECDAEVNSLTAALRLAVNAGDAERRERGTNGRRLVERQYAWPSIVKTLSDACAAYC